MRETETTDLSERELEILRLVATGASNKEIAQKLVISPNTVKVHLRNIFEKIGVVSRTEAAMYAVKIGVIKAGISSNDSAISALPLPSYGEESANEYHRTIQETISIPRSNTKRLLGILIASVLLLLSLIAIIYSSESKFFTGASSTNQSPEDISGSNRWKILADLPTPRAGIAAVVYDNKIYALGGMISSGITGEFTVYSPLENSWKSLPPKPVAVTNFHAAVAGERIFVPGGDTNDGNPTSVLEVYDLRSGTWEKKSDLPFPLSRYALTEFEGNIFIFGGWNGLEIQSSVLEYEPASDKWIVHTPLDTPRLFANAFTINGKILILGGYNDDNSLENTTAYFPNRDQPGDNPWLNLTPIPKVGKELSAVSLADRIYLVSGIQKPNFLSYLPSQDLWQESVESMPGLAKSKFGIVSFENDIFFIGGTDKNGKLSTQTLSYQAIYTLLVPALSK